MLRPIVDASQPDGIRTKADVQVYRDQLGEIDRDEERGLISEPDANAARIEISRRLLKTGDISSEREVRPGAGASRALSILGVSIVPFGLAASFVLIASLLSYLSLGRPGLPGTNHAERASRNPTETSVSEQISRVEARLREHPKDGVGWDVLAPVYLKLRRYRDAANAFQEAIKLLGANPQRLAGFAQAALAVTNGRVTTEIHTAYTELLKQRPLDPIARFWLAMAKEQSGNTAGAADGYRALLSDKRLNEQFRGMVSQRLALVIGNNTASPSANTKLRAPNRAAAAAITALPPGERRKMIEGMVEGLAQRLKSNANNPDGWQRLIRAYVVLGKRAKAKIAYASALKVVKDDSAAGLAIKSLAIKLGLEPAGAQPK